MATPVTIPHNIIPFIPYRTWSSAAGLGDARYGGLPTFAAADGTAGHVVLVLTADNGDRVAAVARLAAPPRLSVWEAAGGGDMAGALFPTAEGEGNTVPPTPPPTRGACLTTLPRLSAEEATGGSDIA